MLRKEDKIYIAGHMGMVGSACWDAFKEAGYNNITGKSLNELDLRCYDEVNDFIKFEKPKIIINAAAKVGGIVANKNYPYDFLIDNMMIQNNLIKSAHDLDVPKFIFLGSSCIYPKFSPQPIKEEYLLTDFLEPTNEAYALAKISGVKLIQSLRKQFGRDYFSLMPTNLYGPNDNFDLHTSHVLPAMIRKFYEAKINNNSTVILWGSGTPKREFLHVKDLAQAILFCLKNKVDEFLYNVGTGVDLTINDLATNIQKVVGHKGKIIWDQTKPDGTPRKLLDVSKLKKMGWSYKIDLSEGIENTYNWYLKNITEKK